MYPYAGFWKRFLAAILDIFPVAVVVGPVAIIRGIIMGSSIGSAVGLLGIMFYFWSYLMIGLTEKTGIAWHNSRLSCYH